MPSNGFDKIRDFLVNSMGRREVKEKKNGIFVLDFSYDLKTYKPTFDLDCNSATL